MADSRLRIVFLDRDSLPAEVDFQGPSVPHELVLHARTRPDQVAERIRDADIVVTNKVQVRAEHLLHAQQLRMIALTATGTDNIDLQACAQRGIVVSNVRGYATHSVPE